jgi:hypothetical protein
MVLTHSAYDRFLHFAGHVQINTEVMCDQIYEKISQSEALAHRYKTTSKLVKKKLPSIHEIWYIGICHWGSSSILQSDDGS